MGKAGPIGLQYFKELPLSFLLTTAGSVMHRTNCPEIFSVHRGLLSSVTRRSHTSESIIAVST